MATTGPARYPGTTTYPGADQYPGQGDDPMVEVLYTTDDAAVASPVWLYAHGAAANDYVRSFETSRGRPTELGEIDAGTATVSLSDRDRTFDPDHNSAIEPGNRWRIRARFSGETQDVFKGVAESYDQQWPAAGHDQITVVRLAEEFKDLNLDALPTTTPPRNTYSDVVMSDNPSGYWPLNENPATLVQPARIPPEPDQIEVAGGGGGGGDAGGSGGFSLEETWWKPGYPRR